MGPIGRIGILLLALVYVYQGLVWAKGHQRGALAPRDTPTRENQPVLVSPVFGEDWRLLAAGTQSTTSVL